MFVAVCDQNFGNSTPRCSNAGPLRPGITASRISHSISSNGIAPGNREEAAHAEAGGLVATVLTTSASVTSVLVC